MPMQPSGVRTLILGAAGRDFHNFNVVYRDDPGTRVVAFTAAQIPGIAGRRYPASLAGARYPDGIPILDEGELEALCRREAVQRVVFAYSDVSHQQLMHLASRALASGADFVLLGPQRTMLCATRPVIAVSGVRTGVGKSQIARWLSRHLRARGRRVAVLRHPMPYGDLEAARVQRFATREDLDAARCTVEEREEYEPHIACGNLVFAGVDYGDVLNAAQSDGDILVWDGGNNDMPFIRPDLHLAVADALRPQQIDSHHPGEAVLRMADVVVVNKVNAAPAASVEETVRGVRAINAHAPILRAASVVRVADPRKIRGKRAIVVEDGPTLTHGGMPHGAGYAAALAYGVSGIVDPRVCAPAELLALFDANPHIGPVLPAMGYGTAQCDALAQTILRSGAEVVIAGTPIDLGNLLHPDIPVVRVRYDFEEAGTPTLVSIVDAFLESSGA